MVSVCVNSVLTPTELSAVLDVAEDIFADEGIRGVTLARIAARAEVAADDLEARFGTARGLLEAVLDRRAGVINDAREIGLAQLPSPDLDSVLCALFRPSMASGRGARAFLSISSYMLSGPIEDHALLGSRFDAVAQLFIEAIRLSIPGLDHAGAAKGYMLSIGVMREAARRMGRMEMLMGLQSPETVNAGIEDAARFAAGGIRAMAQTPVYDED